MNCQINLYVHGKKNPRELHWEWPDWPAATVKLWFNISLYCRWFDFRNSRNNQSKSVTLLNQIFYNRVKLYRLRMIIFFIRKIFPALWNKETYLKIGYCILLPKNLDYEDCLRGTYLVRLVNVQVSTIFLRGIGMVFSTNR